MSFLCMGFHGV